MLAGPQLVAGPAAPGGERARLLSLYVQDYLECVESLPLDIQRNVSLLREVDTRCQGGLRHSASAAGQREGGRDGPEGRAARGGGRPPHMRPAPRAGLRAAAPRRARSGGGGGVAGAPRSLSAGEEPRPCRTGEREPRSLRARR